MTINESKRARLKSYVKVNLGAPFIVIFMVLLLSAAVFLSVGLSSLANSLVADAFYALFVGIVLQLFCFIKYKEKEQTGAI